MCDVSKCGRKRTDLVMFARLDPAGARPIGRSLRGTRLYRLDQSVACDERRFQASRQSLQSAGRIHGVPANRERHAVLAADIAKYGWPPIEADTNRERRFPVLPTLNVPSIKGFEHHVG